MASIKIRGNACNYEGKDKRRRRRAEVAISSVSLLIIKKAVEPRKAAVTLGLQETARQLGGFIN